MVAAVAGGLMMVPRLMVMAVFALPEVSGLSFPLYDGRDKTGAQTDPVLCTRFLYPFLEVGVVNPLI
jgi:hypothetical protein